MAEYVALWGRDIDDDSSPPPDNGSVRNGHPDPITEPIPVISGDSGDGYVDSSGYTDTDAYELDDGYDGYVEVEPDAAEDTQETVRAYSFAGPFIDRRPGSPGDSLTFKLAATTPWYRTRRGLIVLIAVIAVAIVLALIPMLLRSPGPEAPMNVTPTTEPAPTSVQPPSGSGAPSLTSRLAPPPRLHPHLRHHHRRTRPCTGRSTRLRVAVRAPRRRSRNSASHAHRSAWRPSP